MRGDFSRNGFGAANHYSAVLLGQGGLLTDADWREAVDISRHRVEAETRDVVGACGGPIDACAFAMKPGSTARAIDTNAGSPAQFWIATDDGYVLRSTDAGATWSIVDAGTTHSLRAIRFAGATGWAAGTQGTVLRSTDLGASWSAMPAGSTVELRGVAAVGANNAWAVGDAGTILFTADAGTSWTSASADSAQLNGVAFQSAARGIVVGNGGAIFTTVDGGNTWQKRATTSAADLRAVAFVDAGNAWAVGGGGVILRSSDGGATWSAQTSGTSRALTALSMTSATDGVAAGDEGTLLHTTDGGTTWAPIVSGLSSGTTGVTLAGNDVLMIGQDSSVHHISILTGTATGVSLPGAGLSFSAGRYYVRGTLCEVEAPVSYYNQPDRGSVARLGAGQHLVYVQAWQRLLCAIEAPAIREIALGNADPSTRTKTVWQVKTLALTPTSPSVWSCASSVPELDALAWPPAARLSARSEPQAQATSLCDIGATAGYRRLENQLYRIEIQEGGATPRFKWSRENGSVAFGIEGIGIPSTGSPVETVVTLRSRAHDDNLELAVGDWVELVNDDLALEERVGPLFQFLRDGSDRLEIVLAGAVPASLASDSRRHPMLRRWDHRSTRSTIDLVEAQWIDLEDGVQVRFEAGGVYRPGDYWVIPARTASADVDWPRDASGAPLARPPEGIESRVCRLGLITVAADGTVTVDADCRHLFPPLTQLDQLLYVGGDGQDGLPGAPLAQPLAVRVARGTFPVAGAVVRFAIASGSGSIAGATGGTPLDVATDANGVAQCQWTLGADLAVTARHQTVTAHLLDEGGAPLPGTGVLFAANTAFSLVGIGGDGQAGAAGAVLEQPLEVRVAHAQLPFAGVSIQFNVVAGGGAITSANPVAALADGSASATWQIGGAGKQRVEAELRDGAGAVVQRVAFDANIAATGAPAGKIGCAVTVGEGGDVPQLDADRFKELLEHHRGLLCLCFLSGDHKVDGLVADGHGEFRLSIHGCGHASRLHVQESSWRLDRFASIDISNVAFEMHEKSQLAFRGCDEVMLAGLSVLAPDDRENAEFVFRAVEHVTISDTRIRLKVQALSVLFEDGDSNAEISDCDLQGIISFYGPPAVPRLPLPPLPADPLVAAFNTGAVRISAGKGRLRLTSNRLDALAIGREMAAEISNAVGGGNPVIAGVLQDAVLVGNSFDASASQGIAERLVLSSNTFMGKQTDAHELAWFAAGGAGVVGNVAREVGDHAILRIITRSGFAQKAGNLVFIAPP